MKRADLAQGDPQIQVPLVGGVLAVRLITEFELQGIGSAGETSGELFPDSGETGALSDGVQVERIEVMDVEHHLQVGLERGLHQPFHASEERRLDRIRSVDRGVITPADRQSHGSEARCLDAREVFLGDRTSPAGALRRLQRIAQVEAAAQAALLLEDVCCRQTQRKKQDEEDTVGHDVKLGGLRARGQGGKERQCTGANRPSACAKVQK